MSISMYRNHGYKVQLYCTSTNLLQRKKRIKAQSHIYKMFLKNWFRRECDESGPKKKKKNSH